MVRRRAAASRSDGNTQKHRQNSCRNTLSSALLSRCLLQPPWSLLEAAGSPGAAAARPRGSGSIHPSPPRILRPERSGRPRPQPGRGAGGGGARLKSQPGSPSPPPPPLWAMWTPYLPNKLPQQKGPLRTFHRGVCFHLSLWGWRRVK